VHKDFFFIPVEPNRGKQSRCGETTLLANSAHLAKRQRAAQEPANDVDGAPACTCSNISGIRAPATLRQPSS